MKKNLTELVFILDRSGSMARLTEDTIGGFNSFIEKQKRAEGEAIVSAVLFDDDSEVLYNRVPIADVRPMTDEDYWVGGCTAMLDAVGNAIHHIVNVHKFMKDADRPEKTIFIITTDGQENASRRYDYARVKRMVERQKEQYGWEFLFLGANIDAASTATTMGISADRAATYTSDSYGTALNFEILSDTVAKVRASKTTAREFFDTNTDWAEEVKDYTNSKKG